MSRSAIAFTSEHRRIATTLARFGLSPARIGAVLGHDAKTVRKHLAPEIEAGMRQAQVDALTRLLSNIQNEPDGSSARGRRRGSGRSRAPLLEVQDAI